MSEAIVAARRGSPYTMRLFDAVPIAPIWTGLGIASAFFVSFLLLSALQGWTESFPTEQVGLWASAQLRVEIVQALLIGFLPAATAYGLRGAERDLSDLRPVLDLSRAEFSETLRGIREFPGPLLPISGLLALATGLVLPFSDDFWIEPPPLEHPFRAWVTFRTVVLAWLINQTFLIEIVVALRFWSLGRDHAQVDLLDLTPLRPFARHGLRSVLLLMLFVALFSLMFVFSVGGREIGTITSIVSIAIAAAALALPTAGVHRQIRQRKQVELERVNAAIRTESAARLEAGERWEAADSRLSDLIVYRGLIESLSSWPIDLTTLLRFGLYLFVGLGSWLGAAFVERMLGRILD